MTTKVSKPFRREVLVDGVPHTVVVKPGGVQIARKGCRPGPERTWKQLLEQRGAA